MTLEIKVIDDKGHVVAQASGPAWQPVQWKAAPGFPIIATRGADNGVYKIWAITAQPVAVLDLQYGKPPNPNSYKIF